jgi:ribosomal protein L13
MMKALTKSTVSANAATVEKKWVLIDADGLVVGHRQHPARQAQAVVHPARRLW